MSGRLPIRTSDVVQREIAEETFLMPVRGDLARRADMFVLSEVGRFLWTRIDGRRSESELVADVLAVFEVGEDQARADVATFLGQLQEYGLITLGEAA